MSFLSKDVQDILLLTLERVNRNHDYTKKWLEDPTQMRSAEQRATVQSWWTEQAAKIRKQQLRSMGTARDQVRLLSQEGPIASSWLSVVPSKAANTLLTDTDFRSLCRYWLGLPLLQDGTTSKCPLCTGTVDPYGDHFINCKYNGITRRHNALRDAWSYLLSSAAISHKREAVSGTDHRPADILLLGWDRGRDIAVDFTVVSPMTVDALPLSLDVAKRHLGAAEEAKYAKERSTQACTSMRWGMQPAAFSPWGGAGPSARHLLFETIKRVSSDAVGLSAETKSREFREVISLAIAREVARQLSLRCQVLDT